MAPLLSFCIIARNEERPLVRCLTSICKVADEIVVVDTGSTDSTLDVARGFGAKLSTQLWCNDFSAARNESLRLASGKWIVWVDADDVLPESECEKLRRLGSSDAVCAFQWVVEDVGDEGQLKRVFTQIRMFPNRPGVVFEKPVHETLEPALRRLGIPVLPVDLRVRHTGYTDDRTREAKRRRNERILKEWRTEHPDDLASACHLMKSSYIDGRYQEVAADGRMILARIADCSSESNLMVLIAMFTGLAMMQTGDASGGLGVLSSVDQAVSGFSGLSLAKGRCLLALGRESEAERELRRSLELWNREDRNREMSYALDARIDLGWIAEQKGDTGAAVAEYIAALSLPVTKKARIEIADRLVRCGALEEAMGAYQQVIERQLP